MTVVGVIGTSARSAVHSLARAGFRAWAVDQFADRDLKHVAACAVCPHDRYPDALPEFAAQFPPGPILYTGGLENHPHIVAEIARTRELWGNPSEVLARVRDPFALSVALTATGFATPRLAPQGSPCPSEGRWLRKPLHSGGGLGIRFAQLGEPSSPHHYFQEFIDGPALSAIYTDGELIGVTQQLIGEPWLHASAFAYCGNIGPITIDSQAVSVVARLGNVLATEMGVRGLWGLDFILAGAVPFPLEVNPRYTAAVEVLEYAGGAEPNPLTPFPKKEGGTEPNTKTTASQAPVLSPSPLRGGVGEGLQTQTLGKAIYYAPRAITFPHSGPWDADLAGVFDPWRVPGFADIPEPGSAIETGWPVLTFFVTGSTPAEVRERLQSRAMELDRLFAEHSP